MEPMRLRKLAGCINRAPVIRVFLRYGEEENACMYVPIRRSEARTILNDAESKKIETIDAEVQPNGHLLIGEMIDLEEEEEEEEEEENA